jgi:lambda repressor-like predicted transcriptional regulator
LSPQKDNLAIFLLENPENPVILIRNIGCLAPKNRKLQNVTMILRPKPPKMDVYAIRAELARRGFTYKMMSLESGIDAKSFSAALKRPSTKVNSFIAQKLGMRLHELWPFWFDADDELIPAKYRRKLSRQRPVMASHESVAA